MKNRQLLIYVTFALLLASCGGGTTGTTPPSELPSPPPVPPTAPITPTPPTTPVPTPTPTPPDSDIPYYGEWRVLFVTDSGVDFTHSLHITERATFEGLEDGGYGRQFLCTEDTADPCDNSQTFSGGFGFIGDLVLDDGTAPLSISISTQYDASETPELKIFSTEALTVTTNSAGQQVLEADGLWLFSGDSSDSSTGTITATNVGPPRTLDPISVTRLDEVVLEQKTLFR